MIPVLLPLLFAAQVSVVLSTDVTWESPATGDVFIPGDTLQAVWTASEKVVSPSFTICTVDNSTSASVDADCGTAVWPAIDQNGTEYSISLAVPNITGNGNYYLVMKDDLGTVYDTPNFSLALTKADNSISSSTSQPTGTSTSITYLPSHSAPSAAAIAIPLSLVAATLLGALLLLLARARRSRRREKDKKMETRISEKMTSRQSTISFASAGDIERAVLTLAATRGYAPGGTYSHPSAHTNLGGPSEGQGITAAAAAALGMGAFGWAHPGFAPPAHTTVDAYTPAPVPKYAMGSAPRSVHTTATLHPERRSNPVPAPQSQPGRMYHEQDPRHRLVDWSETNWRDTDRMFADEPPHNMSQASGPPRLPAIQVQASSPPLQVEHPPPPPPKQLLPGSGVVPYTPSSASFPPPPEPELHPPLSPGTESNASLSVISNYMHPSPAMPQGTHLAPPDTYAGSTSELRLPPVSLTRTRSLRRLQTVPASQEDEKPLPVRPEDRVGTDLYDAVSRAVGR